MLARAADRDETCVFLRLRHISPKNVRAMFLQDMGGFSRMQILEAGLIVADALSLLNNSRLRRSVWLVV
jgi:hypothetical protein